MKKIIALMLATITAFSCSMVAFASTTILTTTVPAPAYTMNVPEDSEIVFNVEKTYLEPITITNSSGFAKGKNLEVTVSYDDFKSEGTTTTIPYTFGVASETQTHSYHPVLNNESITFEGKDDGTIKTYATYTNPQNYHFEYIKSVVIVEPTNWGKANEGTYTSTITFTAKVVVE